MEQLSRDVMRQNYRVKFSDTTNLPAKIVQFGEGNFLRGFVDPMVHEMNKQGLFEGCVVAVQPTPHGKVVPKLAAQEGLYTLALQGVEAGEVIDDYEVIPTISAWINPYENWKAVLQYAASEDIECIFSNTTEAGISYRKEAFTPEQAVLSYPGKLTAFLYHRFQAFQGDDEKGLIIIPCELIENNGDKLQEIILRIIKDWNLPEGFKIWVNNSNTFCNTLVDRIVPGYPKNITAFQEKIGYEDALLVIGEPYHLFVIEADEKTAAAIPFDQAGLNVKWGDPARYRELKVSLLNAPHTLMFSIGYLAGVDTVYEFMKDKELRQYLNQVIWKEITPVLSFEEEELEHYIASVLNRFDNPFVKHDLTALGLNAFSKFKIRVLPILDKWRDSGKEVPAYIAFSLAALIIYYKPFQPLDEEHFISRREEEEYTVREKKEAVSALHRAWEQYTGDEQSVRKVVSTVLDDEQLWDNKFTEWKQLSEAVTGHVQEISAKGMRKTLQDFMQQKIS